jgi:histidine ammonia-lyase
MPEPVNLTAAALTPAQVEAVARRRAPVRLAPAAREAVAANRAALERAMADDQLHYGCNTGFGAFASTRIPDDQLADLQHNLLRSHAAGAGDLLPEDVVRAMLLLLAASLARARSGVRPELLDSLIDLINSPITPAVPSIGSVGASGDLAPLAHACLPLLGEGEAFVEGRRVDAQTALAAAGLEPITLAAKEGLALINGTHLMAAQLALLSMDLATLAGAAVTATALSIDAALATHAFLDPRVYDARNQPGPARVAMQLRALLKGSEIAASHRDNDPRVQDPYSYRCAPIILGSALQTIDDARRALEHELGAVTDNPLVDDAQGHARIISAGNFHGMPVAIPLDTLPIALAHLAGVSERRGYHILGAFDEAAGLEPFLSPKPGLHSGLMIAQYTAAACCNEIIGLSTPASVANISTSAGVEDYNSFGPRAAAKARAAFQRARTVIAIEFIIAAEALRRRRPLTTGPALAPILERLERAVAPYDADRPIAPDIAAIEALIDQGALSPPNTPAS